RRFLGPERDPARRRAELPVRRQAAVGLQGAHAHQRRRQHDERREHPERAGHREPGALPRRPLSAAMEILAAGEPGMVAAHGAAAAATAARSRYDRVAAWLHWGIGALLLAEIVFGLLLDDIAPRGTPARAGVINLHKSFGIVLGVLIVARIAWRLGHTLPPWPATMSPARRRAAHLGHVALYVCMVVAPLAGYVGS